MSDGHPRRKGATYAQEGIIDRCCEESLAGSVSLCPVFQRTSIITQIGQETLGDPRITLCSIIESDEPYPLVSGFGLHLPNNLLYLVIIRLCVHNLGRVIWKSLDYWLAGQRKEGIAIRH